jgi:hypothetical protein
MFLKSVFLAAALAVASFAADATGVWKADYTSPDGNQRTSTFHLKADGDKLTGKVVSATGEAEIKDGVVKGDDISFTVIRNFNGSEFTIKYTGKVSTNEIKLEAMFGQNKIDIVAKRQTS